jgi:hypothetical protein
MLGALKRFFSGFAEKSAATSLPPVVDPKVPNKAQALPSAS